MRRSESQAELLAADDETSTAATSLRVSDNADGLFGAYREALNSREHLLLSANTPRDDRLDFARSVADGLSAPDPFLECRFLYDAPGSRLYEQICQQPEYYPTRTEDSILARHGADIAQRVRPDRVVELGSGNAEKTGQLLQACLDQRPGLSYVPIDVSATALRLATAAVDEQTAGVQVIGINGTYEDVFPLLAEPGRDLVMFLGSTIGNFDGPSSAAFWAQVSAAMRPGDHLLLGVDLVKDPALIEAAYNDAAGVTAQFTLNLFARINRELGAQVDVSTLRHEALFNRQAEQMEIYTRFTADQTVHIAPLDRRIEISAGTRVLVEISRKFRARRVAEDLRRADFDLVRTYTDDREWFGVLLFSRRGLADGR